MIVGAAFSVLAILGADPSCSSGIADGSTCCYASCGECGADGCSGLPGGASMCCKGPIAESNRTCDQFNPPCRLVPPSPPSPHPDTAAISLDTNATVTKLPTTYLSFTVEAAYWRNSWFDLGGKDDNKTAKYGATLDMLVAALRPAVMRVGGTQADYDVYVNFSSAAASVDCDHLPDPMTDFRCIAMNPEQWRELLGFADRNELSVVFGLNDLYGRPTKTLHPENPLCDEGDAARVGAGDDDACPPRNTSNYEALIAWTIQQKPPGWDRIIAFELGNELNKCLNGVAGARAQGKDHLALKAYLDRVWPKAPVEAAPRPGALRSDGVPATAGPDTHSDAEWKPELREWFRQFANTTHGSIAALTFHEYSVGNGPTLDPEQLNVSFLDPVTLDRSGNGARALLAMLPPSAPGEALPPIWAGESAAATNGGQDGITDTFIDGFWYLDQLGQHALVGVQTFFRQTLAARGGYPFIDLIEQDKTLDGAQDGAQSGYTHYKVEPLPDYWLAVLHKRLMGQVVLNATSDSLGVRVYAHCAPGGGVTLSYMNLDETKAVNLTLPAVLAASSERVEYVLTAGEPIEDAVNPLQSRSVRLNDGDVLEMLPGADGPSLPPLDGRTVHQAGSPFVRVPAGSLGFLVWKDAKLGACAAQL